MEKLYKTLNKLKDNVPEVPKNTLDNHLKYIGVKHTFGSNPKHIYDSENVTVFAEDLSQISKHVQYMRINGVYTR